MKADLHVHSNYSDGSESIETIIQKAKNKGLTHISFVDHDTTAGVNKAVQLGKQYSLTVIPGIEISAYDFKRKRKVHILGYQFSKEAININKLCQPLLEQRHNHTLWQITQIQQQGYHLNLDLMKASAHPSQTLYKQHVMKQLTDASYSSDEYQSLYRNLFKGVGVASGDITYVDAFEAVKAISEDGGIAVVAHPGQLDSYHLIPELVEVGLGGIERNHPDHSEADHEKIERLANRFNLMLTGGSDYHGMFGAEIKVGEIISPVNSLCRIDKDIVLNL